MKLSLLLRNRGQRTGDILKKSVLSAQSYRSKSGLVQSNQNSLVIAVACDHVREKSLNNFQWRNICKRNSCARKVAVQSTHFQGKLKGLDDYWSNWVYQIHEKKSKDNMCLDCANPFLSNRPGSCKCSQWALLIPWRNQAWLLPLT